MRRFILSIVLFVFLPVRVFAQVGFISLLPNPVGDDTLGEYIELRNTGCTAVDVSGYMLSDLSGKSYRIPQGKILSSHENISFPYVATNISLNNSGEEEVFLRDVWGKLVDSYHYSGTQKDAVILTIARIDEDCSVWVFSGSTIWTGSGSQDFSWEISPVISTGSVDSSGVLFTGSVSDAPTGTESGTLSNTDTSYEILSGSTTEDPSITATDTQDMTGAIISVTWQDTFSGTIGTGWVYSWWVTETGALTPQELYYSDSDKNHKIDTLEIVYPYALTGSVDVSKIALFSASWGMFLTKIDTMTGYVLSGSLSGNILVLQIREWDREKTLLSVDNTTKSELRLKSTWDLGFRSVGGQQSDDFLLTKSFHEYKNVFPKLSPDGITAWTGTLSGTLSPQDHSTDGQNFSSGRVFPEIFPTIQYPTNAYFSGWTFFCTTALCRINLTFEPIFSSGLQMRDFECWFGSGDTLQIDSDCNPGTFSYTNSGMYRIEIVSRISPLLTFQKTYPVQIFEASPIYTSPQTSWKNMTLDTGKPVARIAHDGKWKDYYETVGEYELNCYSETCSLNFTAEESYDPEGSNLRFLWIFSENQIASSRDPWTQKYFRGDHVVTLRVIDEVGNFDEILYRIHVLGKREKIRKTEILSKEQKSEKSAKIHLTQEKIKKAKTKKKKYKKLKMVFYSPPKLSLQGTWDKQVWVRAYQCESSRTNHCSINFALTGTLRWYEYAWILDGKEVFRGKNPKSWKLARGSHTLMIRTYSLGIADPISEEMVEIYATEKMKKSPKIQPKKTKKLTSSITKPTIPHSSYDMPVSHASIPEANIFWWLFPLVYLFGSRRWKRRKKYIAHNVI